MTISSLCMHTWAASQMLFAGVSSGGKKPHTLIAVLIFLSLTEVSMFGCIDSHISQTQQLAHRLQTSPQCTAAAAAAAKFSHSLKVFLAFTWSRSLYCLWHLWTPPNFKHLNNQNKNLSASFHWLLCLLLLPYWVKMTHITLVSLGFGALIIRWLSDKDYDKQDKIR